MLYEHYFSELWKIGNFRLILIPVYQKHKLNGDAQEERAQKSEMVQMTTNNSGTERAEEISNLVASADHTRHGGKTSGVKW